MRAREPDAEGYADHGGVKLHREVFGDGAPTLLLLGGAWLTVLLAYGRERLAAVRAKLTRPRRRP